MNWESEMFIFHSHNDGVNVINKKKSKACNPFNKQRFVVLKLVNPIHELACLNYETILYE